MLDFFFFKFPILFSLAIYSANRGIAPFKRLQKMCFSGLFPGKGKETGWKENYQSQGRGFLSNCHRDSSVAHSKHCCSALLRHQREDCRAGSCALYNDIVNPTGRCSAGQQSGWCVAPVRVLLPAMQSSQYTSSQQGVTVPGWRCLIVMQLLFWNKNHDIKL